MLQNIQSIDVTDQEAAAITATVARLQAEEPGLTAEALIARMAHKVVRGWADQVVAKANSDQIRTLEMELRAAPVAVREALIPQLVVAIKAAIAGGG